MKGNQKMWGSKKRVKRKERLYIEVIEVLSHDNSGRGKLQTECPTVIGNCEHLL